MSTESRPAVKTQTRPRGYIENYRPQARTQALLADVAEVLNEYREYWPLSIRQIFYKLLDRYPKTDQFYARLCEHLSNARRGHVIPFSAIRDDGVSMMAPEHFADEEAFYETIGTMGRNYKRDKLARQATHAEVWTEAAGTIPQLARVAGRYSVSVYSCSGFDHLTPKKILAERICSIGKPTVILHLGDYDVDGEWIFRAVAEDVRAFVLADRPWATVDVEFVRLALTEAQVRQYQLPTAPPKLAGHGRARSWGSKGICQLEALPPTVLAEILTDGIEAVLDLDQIEDDRILERLERQRIAYTLPAPRQVVQS